MRIQALINPHAASGKALRILPRLKQRLRAGNHEVDYHVTSCAAEMHEAILAARDRDKDAVLVAGGDGTFHAALPGLLETELPLCLIPCGRGNDFARNVGLPRRLEAAADFPAAPESRSVDIPLVNGRPFGSVACVGFDARVNELAGVPRRFLGGAPAYIWSVMRALATFESIALRIGIDGVDQSLKTTMVSVANGACYGGGMRIAPDARADDGLLDVCVVAEISRWTIMRQFPNVYRGTHTRHPSVTLRRGKAIVISADRAYSVYADGEHVADLPIRCTVGAHRLRVMMPNLAPERLNHGKEEYATA